MAADDGFVSVVQTEFVTVAEAARRFSVSERTIRRTLANAGSTQAQARQVERRTQTGRRVATVYPAGVIRALLEVETDAGSTGPDTGTEQTAYGGFSTNAGATPAEDRRVERRNAGSTAARATVPIVVTVAESELLRRAEVAEARATLLESERDNLRAALEREQETAKAALERLAESERRAQVMIAAVATGKFATENAPGLSVANQIPYYSASGDTHGSDSAADAKVPAPTDAVQEIDTPVSPYSEQAGQQVVEQADRAAVKRPWWYWGNRK